MDIGYTCDTNQFIKLCNGDRMVGDITLQKWLFNHYKIPTLGLILHSQQGSSDSEGF